MAINGDTSEAIFTDILGTSLGKVGKSGYCAIDTTSFGDNPSDNSSFFTGKPHVEDLGYAFLLRNYRADTGKWLTQDLIGYPDGWNNFAYCGNKITLYIDLLGCAEKCIKTRNLNTSVPIIENYQHSWTEIKVTRDEYNKMSSDYKTGEFANKWVNYGSTDNYYSITLSAYKDPNTGKLVKATGDPRDSGAKNIYNYDHDFTLSEIERALELNKKYNNSADYTDIPLGDEVNNCNSYTNTISGGNLPKGIIDSPGIDKKINDSYYE